jgi:hypothetical protein
LDPNVLPAFLEQITGQRWERVRREGTSETASAPDQSILNSRHSSSSTAAAAAAGGSVRVRGTNIDRDTNINNNAASQQEETAFLETITNQKWKRVVREGVATNATHPPPAPGPLTATADAISADGVNNNNVDDDDDDDDDNDIDDDTIYKSCASATNNSDYLHDHPDNYRFPQGLLCYEVNDPDHKFTTSWIMLLASAKNGKGVKSDQRFFYYSCLGVYECPVEGCKLVKNPVHPITKRLGALPAKANGSGVCKVHQKKLEHVACNARMTIRRSTNTTLIEHSGHHSHPRPHEKPSEAAKEWLTNIVTRNKEALPNQIECGTETRLPAGDIHPGLQNQDRLSYMMKKITKRVPKFSLEDIPNYEVMLGGKYKFFQRACLDKKDGTISIKFPAMLEVTRKNGGTVNLEEGEVSMVQLPCLFD